VLAISFCSVGVSANRDSMLCGENMAVTGISFLDVKTITLPLSVSPVTPAYAVNVSVND